MLWSYMAASGEGTGRPGVWRSCGHEMSGSAKIGAAKTAFRDMIAKRRHTNPFEQKQRTKGQPRRAGSLRA